MKFRPTSTNETDTDTQMTSMIDVVFLLLIFFMLTLRIVPSEGDFNINMPREAPQQSSADLQLPLKVRLLANPDGTLQEVLFGRNELGQDDDAFLKLNQEVGGMADRVGTELADELEVEIDADYGLHYQYVIRAVSACTGTIDPKTGQVIRYVEKIKFAPPRQPNG